MIRRIVLAVLVMVLAVGGLEQAEATPGSGAGNGPIRVQITSQGVQFSLSLPHRSYPRHALVRATLTVGNRIQGVAIIHRDFTACPDDYGAMVQDRQAVIQYLADDPGSRVPRFSTCRYRNWPNLQPGKMMRWRTYLVLNGSVVRGQIQVSTAYPSSAGSTEFYLTIPPLTVQLTREDAWKVQVKVAGNELAAQPHSSVPATGPLLYADYAYCEKNVYSVTPEHAVTAWQVSPKDRILSGSSKDCAPPSTGICWPAGWVIRWPPSSIERPHSRQPPALTTSRARLGDRPSPQ